MRKSNSLAKFEYDITESADVIRYIRHVRLRWRLVAVSCAVAVLFTAALTLTMRRQYTATARIMIAPPAGAEPRTAVDVSAVYLESLKTYEQLAANDDLFRKAVDRFQLRTLSGRRTIEAIKKSVLRVGLVRNSRILEIAVTLPEATKAQALAQFLAEQTVGLNQSMNAASGRDLVDTMAQQERDAEVQFDRSEKALSRMMTNEPTDDLQNEIHLAEQLRGSLEDQRAELRLELAGGNDTQEQTRARLAEAQRQLEALNRDVAAKERLLAGRIARRGHLEGERRADQAELATVQAHLRDARNQVGFRGERLTVIDRGVIPERASSPNVSLNLSTALVLGGLLALGFLMLELAFQQQSSGDRGVVRALAEAREE